MTKMPMGDVYNVKYTMVEGDARIFARCLTLLSKKHL